MQRDAKKNFRVGMIVLLFVIIVAYAIYQSRNLLEGPEIIVNEPKNGETITTSPLLIKGVAKNINSINLDDRPIFIDEQGNFSEKLLLYPGYNIIRLEAKDKFGKEKILDLEVVYAPPPTTAVPLEENGTSTVSTSTASSSGI